MNFSIDLATFFQEERLCANNFCGKLKKIQKLQTKVVRHVCIIFVVFLFVFCQWSDFLYILDERVLAVEEVELYSHYVVDVGVAFYFHVSCLII